MTTNLLTGTAAKLKRNIGKLLTAGLLAGAVALAVPTKADAQVVVFAGRPVYGVQVYPRYDRFRVEEFRHRDWRFDHRFDRRFYR